jgi:antitoxin component of RelBE/YafQ-DinJ toxin-antitoxin module
MIKKHTFNVRLDDDGRARLRALAERLGIDTTDAARFAIKHAFDELVSRARVA